MAGITKLSATSADSFGCIRANLGDDAVFQLVVIPIVENHLRKLPEREWDRSGGDEQKRASD